VASAVLRRIWWDGWLSELISGRSEKMLLVVTAVSEVYGIDLALAGCHGENGLQLVGVRCRLESRSTRRVDCAKPWSGDRTLYLDRIALRLHRLINQSDDSSTGVQDKVSLSHQGGQKSWHQHLSYYRGMGYNYT
jgi:hypothetical protein